MIIKCIHGYFIVREQSQGEVSRFNTLYDQDLESDHDYFTFSHLVGAPEHSLIGQSYLGLLATLTYSGKPWEVMEQNGYVYDFTFGTIRPVVSVTHIIEPIRRNDSWFLKGLIQPGSLTKQSQRVVGYTCHLDIKRSLTYNYSELTYA